jgi:valyl-tRNA synthetase
MKVLHPFMPFITEEIWQNIAERNAGEVYVSQDIHLLGSFNIRLSKTHSKPFQKFANCATAKALAPKEAFEIIIKTDNEDLYKPFQFLIEKIG